MVFTPDMCASRWSIGNAVIGHDGHVSNVKIRTQPMNPSDIVDCVAQMRPHPEGMMRIYNIYQNFNKRPGDFLDGDYFAQSKTYVMSRDYEQMVDDMAELSLTHKVIDVEVNEHGLGLLTMESTDGTTNIDANVVEAVMGAFKRKRKRRRKNA